MLRITLVDNGHDDPTLRLEGVVTGPWVEELRRSCERALGRSRRLTLDLANVSFVDRSGVVLFGELTRRDVVLSNCSGFVEEQLKA